MGNKRDLGPAEAPSSDPPSEWDAGSKSGAGGRTTPSYERFRALIALSSEAVYRMNADWTQMLQLIGQGFLSDTDRSTDRWQEKYVHPDDWPMVRSAIETAIRTKSRFDLEHRVRHVDGSLGWMHSRAVPILSAEGEILEWFGMASDLTSRQEFQQQLQLATEGANVGTWTWDFATDHLEWSDRCRALLFTPSDQDLSADYVWSIVHPDDLARLRQKVMVAKHSDARLEAEFRVLKPEGGEVWIRTAARAFPLGASNPRGMHGIIADTSEYKAVVKELALYRNHLEELVAERTNELAVAEAANQKLTARLKVAASAAGLGIWAWDFSDCMGWDERMTELYEVPPTLEPGRIALTYWWSRVHPDDRAPMEVAVRKVKDEHHPMKGTFRIVLPGDRVRHIQWTLQTQFDAAGNPMGVVGTNEDITARVAAEEELRASKQLAEAANLAKTKFLAAASHDLRQPLTAIALYLHTLRGSGLDENQKELVSQLQHANDTQKNMLNSLLDVARLDANAVLAKFGAVDAEDLFVRIEDMLWMQCREKGLRFIVRYPRKKITLHTDEILLKVILRNLLANSLKYSNTGTIMVSLRRRGDRALIQVWDTGIGIGLEHMLTVFDEFYQVNNPERDSAKGLGLGLSIVTRLAALIGAEISYRSVLGKGSVFGVSVPLSKGEANHPREPRNRNSAAHNGHDLSRRFVGLRVVIIEDNPGVRNALLTAFKSMAIEAQAFGDAESALAAPDITEADYYISDFRLPGPINGLQLLTEIRGRKGSPLQAVILTGETMLKEYPELKTSNWKVMTKPCDTWDLLTALTGPPSQETG